MTTHELPEWETPTAPRKRPILGTSSPLISALSFDRVKALFNRKHTSSTQEFDKEATAETIATPGRKRWRPSRRVGIIITVVAVLLIALIIGLAVGLRNKSSVPNLPPNINQTDPLTARPRKTCPSPPTPPSSPAT